MKIVLDGYTTYCGSECLLSCFYNYCRFFHFNVEENEIFIFGNGLQTKYSKVTGASNAGLVLKTEVNSSIFNFCREFAIRIDCVDEVESVIVEDVLLESVLEGIPLIIKVEPEFLTYSPVYAGGYGENKYISVIGIDKEHNDLLISDGYIPTHPTTTYQGWYSYKLIKKARSFKSNYFVYIDPNSFGKIFKHQEAFKNEIMLAKMKSSLYEYLDGKHIKDEYTGNEAIKQFAADIPEICEVDDNDFIRKMIKLNFKLKSQGLISSRKLFYEAIINIDWRIGRNSFTNVIYTLSEVLKSWENICLLFMKAGFLKSRLDINRIAQKVKILGEKENIVFEEVYKML